LAVLVGMIEAEPVSECVQGDAPDVGREGETLETRFAPGGIPVVSRAETNVGLRPLVANTKSRGHSESSVVEIPAKDLVGKREFVDAVVVTGGARGEAHL